MATTPHIDDELIITTNTVQAGPHVTISTPELPALPSLPKVPSLPSVSTLHIQSSLSPYANSETSIIESPTSWFGLDAENQQLVIHGICDVILFYLCFTYINSMYATTKKSIITCREALDKLREQYGLHIDQ